MKKDFTQIRKVKYKTLSFKIDTASSINSFKY